MTLKIDSLPFLSLEAIVGELQSRVVTPTTEAIAIDQARRDSLGEEKPENALREDVEIVRNDTDLPEKEIPDTVFDQLFDDDNP